MIAGGVFTSKEATPQAGNVKVVCRFRPLNDREKNEAGQNLCVKFLDEKTCTVNVSNAFR